MTPLEVIASIRQAGGSITVNDGKLKVVAPPEVVQALRQALEESKAILLSLLAIKPVVETEIDRPDWWNLNISDRDNRDLDQFFGWSSDPERRAIQWTESLSRIQGQQVLEAAVVQLNEIAGGARCANEKLRTNELSQTVAVDSSQCQNELNEPYEQSIEPENCPKCGSISVWLDATGKRHCDQCDPPIRSQFVASRVQALRERYEAGIYPVKNRKVRRLLIVRNLIRKHLKTISSLDSSQLGISSPRCAMSTRND